MVSGDVLDRAAPLDAADRTGPRFKTPFKPPDAVIRQDGSELGGLRGGFARGLSNDRSECLAVVGMDPIAKLIERKDVD